ncbi:nucleotide-diphospho-sugar transferase, partial [Fistulina hepatica ATCC 64428]
MSRKRANAPEDKLTDEDEEPLQAVILADSFNKRFRPLTANTPRCLLPICNAPLLSWTFESLSLAGVREVFVVCRSHGEQVRQACENSKYARRPSDMKITTILIAQNTYSPGDALRDLYTRGLVTNDFVLVHGDLVSNIAIDEVVRVHKERRKTNKDAIMTMVVKESGYSHRTRRVGDSSIFVLDPNTSECLYYEHVPGWPHKRFARIPREILAEHPEVEVRNDLIDCGIDVCSAEVPSLFQDNFDYSDIRRDFVHGVLTSDLLMKNIHCYVAKEGYAARVTDTRSYDAVSKDILSRWTFPLVPDDNHPSGHVYEQSRGNRYLPKDNSVVLARTCKIGNNTLIGPLTQILEGTQVVSSVIGQRCSIGPGTVIKGSYIFDDTTIGANCVVESSIIGAGVTLKDSTTVQRGCLLGDGVIVGPNTVLQPLERLSAKRVTAHPESLSADSEDDESSGDNSDIDMAENRVYAGEDIADLEEPESELSEDESSDSEDSVVQGSSGGTASDVDIDVDNAAELEFQREATQSLERAFAEGHSVENAAVELKTLRMAANVSNARVREAVVSGIVDQIPLVSGGHTAQRLEIAKVVNRWGQLINQIGGVEPVETVAALQEHCSNHPDRMPLFGQVLAILYQTDIVEEEHIRAWY